jgi:hypothetical protein
MTADTSFTVRWTFVSHRVAAADNGSVKQLELLELRG